MTTKVVIVVLLVLNGFLLFKVSNYEQNIDIPERSLYELENYGLQQFQDSARTIVINAYRGEGVFAITFLNELGCLSCVQNDIESLNVIDKDIKDKLIIVGISRNKDYFKNLGLKLEYIHFNHLNDIYKEQIPIGNPFTIVLDKNFDYDFNLTNTNKPHSKKLRMSYYDYLSSYFK